MNSNDNSFIMKISYQKEQIRTIEKQAAEKIYGVKQPHKLRIQIYDTEDSFEALSVHWNELAEKVQGHIYMSNEWAKCWWRYFGKNKQRFPFFITVWHLDELVALAPMYIGTSKLGPFVVERRLQIIGSGGSPNEQWGYLDDYGISDFLDFLVDEAYARDVAGLLLKFFRSNRYGIDTVIFHQAGDESFIMKYLYPQIEESDLRYDLQHTDTCPTIDLRDQDSLPSYIKQVKSNARRRFRQTLRAVGTEDGFEIETIDSSKEITSSVERLIALHQERWNQLGFPGVFHDKRFTGFFKEIVRSANLQNWLWFKQARDQSGICALRMILKYNGRYYDYISGFDNDCPSSKYRPGIGLLLDLVEEAIDEKITRIELLRGEEGYKYDFTSDNFKNWRLTFTPENPGSKFVSAARVLLKVAATLYKYTSREFRLIQVQYRRYGILKMFWGYLNFRAESIRQKLKS